MSPKEKWTEISSPGLGSTPSVKSVLAEQQNLESAGSCTVDRILWLRSSACVLLASLKSIIGWLILDSSQSPKLKLTAL